MQVRIIEELALLNGSTFFSLITQLGTENHDAGRWNRRLSAHLAAVIHCADRLGAN